MTYKQHDYITCLSYRWKHNHHSQTEENSDITISTIIRVILLQKVRQPPARNMTPATYYACQESDPLSDVMSSICDLLPANQVIPGVSERSRQKTTCSPRSLNQTMYTEKDKSNTPNNQEQRTRDKHNPHHQNRAENLKYCQVLFSRKLHWCKLCVTLQ